MAIIALFYAEQKLRIARCNLQEIERDLKLWEQARYEASLVMSCVFRSLYFILPILF